jgi:hypothetical protein
MFKLLESPIFERVAAAADGAIAVPIPTHFSSMAPRRLPKGIFMLDFAFWVLQKLCEYCFPPLMKKLRRGEISTWNDLACKQINKHLEHQAVTHGPYPHEPVLVVQPRQPPAPEIRDAVERKRAALGVASPNDPHALVTNNVAWGDDPLQFTLLPMDYAQLCVLRETGSRETLPRVLSANALIVCAERRTIMLHRRSDTSATYPGCLHTIGGGYWPPGLDGRDGDGRSLRHTVVREVHEETRVNIVVRDSIPVLALEEVQTGFIQMAFLGCTIDEEACRHVEANKEGHVVWVGFDELEKRLLNDDDWVPTAKASVLAWLAMAAPGAGDRPRFGKKRPGDLFRTVVASQSD